MELLLMQKKKYQNVVHLIIKEFVAKNFIDNNQYVMGKPITYYGLTHQGIMHFSDRIKKKRESSNCVTKTGELLSILEKH